LKAINLERRDCHRQIKIGFLHVHQEFVIFMFMKNLSIDHKFLSQLNPRKGSIGLGNKTVHASLRSALLEVLVNIGYKPVAIPFRTNCDAVGESMREKPVITEP